MLSKRMGGIWTHTTFRCDQFGWSWISNRVCIAKLWPFYGYNIGGQIVNTTFRVTWSHRRAILHHSEWPIIFRVRKHNEDELFRTLSSWNNASAGEKVRVVAGWVIEHVKHEFFGFDATSPGWTCSLSGSWMEGWCIVPYVIAHISVRGWAHGRVLEGGRVHAKDKIIRNSILQAGSGLRNIVEADEWDVDAYNFSLWSIW